MKLNDTGYYENNGQIFEHIGHCPYPTAILQNVKTGETQHIVPDSLNAKEYKKLITEG